MSTHSLLEGSLSSTRLRAQERRAQILAAALDLFARRGYRGTTTRAIADHAQVSEGLLFQHFPTKRDLLLASLDLPAIHELGANLAGLQAESAGDPGVRWETLIATTLTFLRAQSNLVRVLYHEAALDPLVREAFERDILARFRSTATALVESAPAGYDPPVVVRAAFGMLLNFVVIEDWLDSPVAPRYPDSIVIAQLTRLITRGCCPQPEPTKGTLVTKLSH